MTRGEKSLTAIEDSNPGQYCAWLFFFSFFLSFFQSPFGRSTSWAIAAPILLIDKHAWKYTGGLQTKTSLEQKINAPYTKLYDLTSMVYCVSYNCTVGFYISLGQWKSPVEEVNFLLVFESLFQREATRGYRSLCTRGNSIDMNNQSSTQWWIISRVLNVANATTAMEQ